MTVTDKSEDKKQLTEKEKKLLGIIRGIGYGEISLVIRNSEPVVVEEVVKKIKL
jgi:hypothetical protein